MIRRKVPKGYLLALSINYSMESGIEVEELLSAAHEGFWKACLSFDPDKGASFSTYLYKGVRNQFLTLSSRRRKENQSQGREGDINETFYGEIPAPDARALFLDKLEDLSQDAWDVVDLVLNNDLMELLGLDHTPPPGHIRGPLRRYLMREWGFSNPRVDRAYRQLKAVFGRG